MVGKFRLLITILSLDNYAFDGVIVPPAVRSPKGHAGGLLSHPGHGSGIDVGMLPGVLP